MKTKLVYVLTCAPEKNYIEQALLSVYSARHYNPNATIVLIVDNLTDKLFIDSRNEILNYITEKIVVNLDHDLTMMDRSRWLKTSVRNLVQGDLLFIDSDTLITQSLKNIDECEYAVAAVLESHLPIESFNKYLYDKVEELSSKIGWSIADESYYFSSGVIYVKDISENYELFNKWHSYWIEGRKKGISIDQPSLAKANIAMNRPIKILADIWNCVMYTQPLFDKKSKILHFCSFRNMSYIYSDEFLYKVKLEGVEGNSFVLYSILNPYKTYLPFDSSIYFYKFRELLVLLKTITYTSKLLKENLSNPYINFISKNEGINRIIISIFDKKLFLLGSVLWILYKLYRVKFNKNYRIILNACSI